MAKQRKFARKILQRRWLRDFTSGEHVYLPEALAKPSRMCEGFELRADGTYCNIGSGPNDATVFSEGTWRLEEDAVLMLRPAKSGHARKIRIVEASEERLVVEE